MNLKQIIVGAGVVITFYTLSSIYFGAMIIRDAYIIKALFG